VRQRHPDHQDSRRLEEQLLRERDAQRAGSPDR